MTYLWYIYDALWHIYDALIIPSYDNSYDALIHTRIIPSYDNSTMQYPTNILRISYDIKPQKSCGFSVAPQRQNAKTPKQPKQPKKPYFQGKTGGKWQNKNKTADKIS